MRKEIKLDPEFRGPLVIAEVLEGDRHILETLDGKRLYKYSHDGLRKMPDCRIPPELDVCSDDNNSDHDDMSTSISEDQYHYANNSRQSDFARVSGR